MPRDMCSPLREGGSLPAIVEADDLGMYVLKFRGAGQGPLALVAELVAGEIGRTLGLSVPELVLAEVDPVLGRSEPDAEIRHLLKASAGLNLALDYLPGSIMFRLCRKRTSPPPPPRPWPSGSTPSCKTSTARPRNANLLVWHRKLYFIDHGAALYFHHNWPTAPEKAASPFPESQHHVLLRWASAIEQAGQRARAALTPDRLTEILQMVPDSWLEAEDTSASQRRHDYLQYFTRRLEHAANFEQEAVRAHQRLV